MDCRSWFLEIRSVFGRAALGLSSMERRGGVLEFMVVSSNGIGCWEVNVVRLVS